MWCVPKYSNPTGDGVLGARRSSGSPRCRRPRPDFRLFWDNAYAVHHLTDEPATSSPTSSRRARATGIPNRAFVFGSTSKITLAGAGLALFGGVAGQRRAGTLGRMGQRTIGRTR